MKGTTAIVLIAIIVGKVKSIAMMCDGRTAKKLFKAPQPFKCDNDDPTIYNVTTWKRNIREYRVQAKSMKVTEKTCKVSNNFFGSKEIKNQIKKSTGQRLNTEIISRIQHVKTF